MRWLSMATVVAIGALGGLTACSGDPGPTPVVAAFLRGLPTGDLAQVQLVDANGTAIGADTVVKDLKKISGDLDPAAMAMRPSGKPRVSGSDATADVEVDWAIATGVTWHYSTTVRLTKPHGDWRVVWTPQTVHPKLQHNESLVARPVATSRGEILDRDGKPIVTRRPVVLVGIEPRGVRDPNRLFAELDAALASVGVHIDLTDLRDRVAKAKPDAFVDVVTLRRDAYDRIRARIHDLPGTVFAEQTRDLAPTRAFARALLGTVGPVTLEQMTAHPGKYTVSDHIGQSGLQSRYDDILRGAAGVTIVATAPADDEGSDGGTSGSGGADQPSAQTVLFRAEPRPGTVVKTTLDQRVQNAADAALAGVPNRSALVAIRISDSSIVGVANGPDGGDLNLAFTAAVPPGSTFKMVSALALLDAGAVGLDTVVDCPRTFTVGGRQFHNANSFALGQVPFRVNFAKSCNTAFASLAPKLGPTGLRTAAESVGIGAAWSLGAELHRGSVGANMSTVESAAAAFGQGTTQVSPLVMAGAVAAVARGEYRQPNLFTELPPGVPPAATPGAGASLRPASIDALRTMMREVVTSGTATALAGLAGGPVYAKTGTAEYDNNPAHTHSWTIGWQGDIAFAVFVEDGGSSAATAIPVVATFLRGLNSVP